MGRSLLSSPAFFVSTSAAFLFWFLLWFACILAFSFELRVDVASLELTAGCLDCFVRRLFPLLCLPFAVVYFFLPRFQYRNWNFMNRIAVRGLQFLLIKKPIYHLANQSFPTKSWNLAPNRDNLLRENHFLFYKIALVDETHLHAGRHYFLTALNKSLRTSRETNFRLIQAFN